MPEAKTGELIKSCSIWLVVNVIRNVDTGPASAVKKTPSEAAKTVTSATSTPVVDYS